MLWLLGLGSSCIAGLLIGLRYRTPAALAASAVAGAAAVAIGVVNHASRTETLILAMLCIGGLQIGYLGGLWLSSRRLGRSDPRSQEEDGTL